MSYPVGAVVRYGLHIGMASVVCCAGTTGAAMALPTPHANTRVSDINLLASQALIMTGTAMHVVEPTWMQMALDNFIEPTEAGDYTAIPVTTPAQFWPFSGPEDMLFDLSVQEGIRTIDAAITAHANDGPDAAPMVVFGYSQSSVIATEAKVDLTERVAAGAAAPAVSFIMLANLNRPNGGINSRFAGATIEELGWTFSSATPTDTPFLTVDVARQYDLFADFPSYPLNVFATANAVVALLYGAHDYTAVTLDPADPGYDPNTVVQQRGDTTYYFIPAATLPLLRPLRDMGLDPVLLDAAEPILRVLVEFGYDRSIPFGEPAPAVLTDRQDLDQLETDLASAIRTGQAVVGAATPAPAVAWNALPTNPARVGTPSRSVKSPPAAEQRRAIAVHDSPQSRARTAQPQTVARNEPKQAPRPVRRAY